VLSILCGKQNASQILDVVGSIRHREVFDAHQDFPHLGERLMKLQSYNSKQQPSAWRTMLFDRRDPQQRFTFFGTVVIIGGISILLSAIQTSLAIAQLAISQKKC
jgi:hypothetical protein